MEFRNKLTTISMLVQYQKIGFPACSVEKAFLGKRKVWDINNGPLYL
jgi:hypothetical protein